MISYEAALGWFVINVISTIILAFFSMQEMACVSFNKIRLQYYVSKGMKRAQWLSDLLRYPERLFGTTLICVNTAMFIGSECARQSYLALGWNPDLASLVQVAFVLLFGELAPMFAARRFAETVALVGAPLLYFTAKMLTPILWTIGWVSKLADVISGRGAAHEHVVLNQDDLQRILDAQEEDRLPEGEGEEVSTISRNIFSLRNKDAKQVMQPIQSLPSLPSNATVAQLRKLLTTSDVQVVLIYHKDIMHIVGVAHPRSFVRSPDTSRVRDQAAAPWFITQNTKVIQILQEFRRNNKQLAIVLNNQGHAIGIISLEGLTEEIFGKIIESRSQLPSMIIDRTFPGDMLVSEFNEQFDVVISKEGNITLAELLRKTLGHHPELGEKVFIFPFEFTVKETTLTDVKSVAVTTPRM